MNSVVSRGESHVIDALRREGHIFLRATQIQGLLASSSRTPDDWQSFCASWNGMPVDGFMADGGRYRRRRHAVFSIDEDGTPRRQQDQPHYQSRAYNALNGGIPRWFEPIPPETARSESLTAILHLAARTFGGASPSARRWFVEVHQFRIEARAVEQGLPTPEGVHRDGVDYVLVLLITRQNIAEGVTEIYAPDASKLGQFTLTDPFDAVLLDDHRVHHGVTPVRPLNPLEDAWRDVLVVTFCAQGT